MPKNKLLELVGRIESKTISDKLTWESTADPNGFQTTLANYVVRIREFYDLGEQEPDYNIKIIDSNGVTMESITNRDLVNAYLELNQQPDPHPYHQMANIFKKAKRQALGVDKAIDSILSELE